MTYKRKSWSEKLRGNPNFPKTLSFDPKFPCGKALTKMGAKPGDSVVLAPALEVDRIMRSVPKGMLVTLPDICRMLAGQHGTGYCCTLTTGIFTVIAANAADEKNREGGSDDLPWWRTLKADGLLNDKFPGGQEEQKVRLEKEGFAVVPRGWTYRVDGFENHLWEG